MKHFWAGTWETQCKKKRGEVDEKKRKRKHMKRRPKGAGGERKLKLRQGEERGASSPTQNFEDGKNSWPRSRRKETKQGKREGKCSVGKPSEKSRLEKRSSI